MRLSRRLDRLEAILDARPDPTDAIFQMLSALYRAWGTDQTIEPTLETVARVVPGYPSWGRWTRRIETEILSRAKGEKPNKTLGRLTQVGLLAGNPKDQLVNLIEGGYIAQPKQLLFHAAARSADYPNGPTQIGFGGARGPGKSHAMFAQITLDDAKRYPGLKILLLRKVGKALKESAGDLRLRILRHTPHTLHKSTGTLTFPNGSRVILGHFKNESDIDNYVGLEYDLIGIEEATTLPAQKYRLIRTCCRTSKPGWRPRIYSNANPGGVGHTYYNRIYVEGSRTDPDVTFIPATYRDNIFLDRNYVKTLESLTGWLRRAWLEGDWNIHAGTYFTNFEPAIHIIKPFDIHTGHYRFYLTLDYGFAHPTAALLLAVANDQVYVVDEYRAQKRLTPQHSKALNSMLTRNGIEHRSIRSFTMGVDAWKRGKDGTTVAQEYEREGWNPEQAVMGRVQGAQEILRRFGDRDANIEPSLWIFENCTGLIEQLPQMQHDPKRLEDVLKVDADEEGFGGDDFYDALRYGLQEVATDLGPLDYDTLSFRR
ncbi:MAG: hypothetical protein AMJ88_16810 [Anaerolineae bacterium SM23_ 63]|nr:MAG: hypothetical protein AMJ88_16810 [Anaerolineae bacterium SM23_ 63]